MSTLSLYFFLSLSLLFASFLSDCGIKSKVSLSQTKEVKRVREAGPGLDPIPDQMVRHWVQNVTMVECWERQGMVKRARKYWAQRKKVVGT